MTRPNLSTLNEYKILKKEAGRLNDSENHLQYLILQPGRFEDFSIKEAGLFLDFSRQRIDSSCFNSLIKLAQKTRAIERFKDMCAGKIVNLTENRAAYHTGNRNGLNPDAIRVNSQIKAFVSGVNNNQYTGSTGKSFNDVVVIGIGGSYLGCEFVYQALKTSCKVTRKLHFLSNVDIDNFGMIAREIDPEKTLWVVISKSYTTTETLANLNQVLFYLKQNQLDPKDHLVTITAKGSPGDQGNDKVLQTFHMFDYIGGRYSVTSAVGGVPLSLCFGYDIFERFLSGCDQLDRHAQNSEEHRNIPLISALLNIWNSNFLNYSALAIIPYSSALSRLAPHVQQVYMESLGKQTSVDGDQIDYPTGIIIFGEPGTNAQHSFFQLAHQGMAFPVEFIGVCRPAYQAKQTKYKGVDNHQELWANMIAQATALAVGKDDEDSARKFPGNRPSSTILINDLSPENIGRLLSFYEARTVFEGFILQINPFDQFGVELGKVTASGIRNHIALKNEKSGHDLSNLDAATRFYIESLFNGTF